MNGIKVELIRWAESISKAEKISLNIVKPRKRKLGDFSIHPLLGSPKITLNSNLSNEEFVLTFLHELAHKKVYDQYGRKVPPHGKEWKTHFRTLLTDALQDNFLSPYHQYLATHHQAPRARILRKKEIPGTFRLAELENGTSFSVEGSRMQFILQKKIRTRYLCQNLKNGRLYTINGAAQVWKLD